MGIISGIPSGPSQGDWESPPMPPQIYVSGPMSDMSVTWAGHEIPVIKSEITYGQQEPFKKVVPEVPEELVADIKNSDRDLLLKAHARMEELLELATRGPWVYYPTNTHGPDDGAWTISRPYCNKGHSFIPDVGGQYGCDPDCGANVLSTGKEECEEDSIRKQDVEYISTLNPVVGRYISEILLNTATAMLTDSDILVTEDVLMLAKGILGQLDEQQAPPPVPPFPPPPEF